MAELRAETVTVEVTRREFQAGEHNPSTWTITSATTDTTRIKRARLGKPKPKAFPFDVDAVAPIFKLASDERFKRQEPPYVDLPPSDKLKR